MRWLTPICACMALSGCPLISGDLADLKTILKPEGEVYAGCRDEVDNDKNGLVDCSDPSCVNKPACEEVDSGMDTEPFQLVSAGGFHTCGIDEDDAVWCWGRGANGQLEAPVEAFKGVSTGYAHTCGIKADDTVACWSNYRDGRSDPPGGMFLMRGARRSHPR